MIKFFIVALLLAGCATPVPVRFAGDVDVAKQTRNCMALGMVLVGIYMENGVAVSALCMGPTP
jgi:hypothetical protein